MEAYRDRDMGQLGALIRLFQCKSEGRVVYRCRLLYDATNDADTTFLQEIGWARLTEHMLGSEKNDDIIELLCFFEAMAPYHPWRGLGRLHARRCERGGRRDGDGHRRRYTSGRRVQQQHRQLRLGGRQDGIQGVDAHLTVAGTNQHDRLGADTYKLVQSKVGVFHSPTRTRAPKQKKNRCRL